MRRFIAFLLIKRGFALLPRPDIENAIHHTTPFGTSVSIQLATPTQEREKLTIFVQPSIDGEPPDGGYHVSVDGDAVHGWSIQEGIWDFRNNV